MPRKAPSFDRASHAVGKATLGQALEVTAGSLKTGRSNPKLVPLDRQKLAQFNGNPAVAELARAIKQHSDKERPAPTQFETAAAIVITCGKNHAQARNLFGALNLIAKASGAKNAALEKFARLRSRTLWAVHKQLSDKPATSAQIARNVKSTPETIHTTLLVLKAAGLARHGKNSKTGFQWVAHDKPFTSAEKQLKDPKFLEKRDKWLEGIREEVSRYSEHIAKVHTERLARLGYAKEDFAQDVFLRLLGKYGEFQQGRSLEPKRYAFAVARNWLRQLLRGPKRIEYTESEQHHPLDELRYGKLGLNGVIQAAEIRQATAKAVDRLKASSKMTPENIDIALDVLFRRRTPAEIETQDGMKQNRTDQLVHKVGKRLFADEQLRTVYEEHFGRIAGDLPRDILTRIKAMELDNGKK